MSPDYVVLHPEQVQLLRAAGEVSFHHDITGGRIMLNNETEFPISSLMGGAFHSGFCYLDRARFKPEWLTLARSLQAGDRVSLRWQPDSGTNDHLRRVGLHADELHLRVRRSDRQVDDYLIHYTVTPDWGRMVS